MAVFKSKSNLTVLKGNSDGSDIVFHRDETLDAPNVYDQWPLVGDPNWDNRGWYSVTTTDTTAVANLQKTPGVIQVS